MYIFLMFSCVFSTISFCQFSNSESFWNCWISGSRNQDYLLPATVSPSSPTAISKTFQILYKNEEIILDDCFLFSLHMLVDSDKVNKQIDIFCTKVLWYSMNFPVTRSPLPSLPSLSKWNLMPNLNENSNCISPLEVYGRSNSFGLSV